MALLLAGCLLDRCLGRAFHGLAFHGLARLLCGAVEAFVRVLGGLVIATAGQQGEGHHGPEDCRKCFRHKYALPQFRIDPAVGVGAVRSEHASGDPRRRRGRALATKMAKCWERTSERFRFTQVCHKIVTTLGACPTGRRTRWRWRIYP